MLYPRATAGSWPLLHIALYVVGPEDEQPGYTMLKSPERFSVALEELIQLIGRRTTELRTQLEAQP